MIPLGYIIGVGAAALAHRYRDRIPSVKQWTWNQGDLEGVSFVWFGYGVEFSRVKR